MQQKVALYMHCDSDLFWLDLESNGRVKLAVEICIVTDRVFSFLSIVKFGNLKEKCDREAGVYIHM